MGKNSKGPIIQMCSNNIEKYNTYYKLIEELDLAYKNKEYNTVIINSYALIEDCLLSILKCLGIIKDRDELYPLDIVDEELKFVFKHNLCDKKGKKRTKNERYRVLNNISSKLNYIKNILKYDNTVNKYKYVSIIQTYIKNNINEIEFISIIDTIEKNRLARNEIMHASYNKNFPSLEDHKEKTAREIYNSSKKLKNLTSKFRTKKNRISVRDKILNLVNDKYQVSI